MKVYVAVVSSVTDYRKEQNVIIDHTSVHGRKEQSVFIDHTSVHGTMEEATKAVMTALVELEPDLLASFSVDWETMLGVELKGHVNRLCEYMRSEDIEAGWEEDDVPYDDSDDGVFKKFQDTEMQKIQENAEKIREFVRKGEKDIPFTKYEIPELPNGEYVWNPIVWRIDDAEVDLPP